MAVTITSVSVDDLPGIYPWRHPVRKNGISEGYGFPERWPDQSVIPFLSSQIGNGQTRHVAIFHL